MGVLGLPDGTTAGLLDTLNIMGGGSGGYHDRYKKRVLAEENLRIEERKQLQAEREFADEVVDRESGRAAHRRAMQKAPEDVESTYRMEPFELFNAPMPGDKIEQGILRNSDLDQEIGQVRGGGGLLDVERIPGRQLDISRSKEDRADYFNNLAAEGYFTPEMNDFLGRHETAFGDQILSANQVARNPMTGQEEYRAPSSEQNLLEFLNQPGNEGMRAEWQRKNKAIGGAPESIWAQEGGKYEAKLFNDYRGMGAAAQESINDFNAMEAAFEKIGDTSGWAESKAYLANRANELMGLEVGMDDLSDVQYAQALTGKMIKTELDKSTGPQTDNDREFVRTILPSTGSTKESNEKLMAHYRSKLYRDSYFSREANRIANEIPGYDRQQKAFDNLRKKRESFPTFKTSKKGTPVSFYAWMARYKALSPQANDDDMFKAWSEL